MRKKHQEGLTVVGLLIAVVCLIVLFVFRNYCYKVYEDCKTTLIDQKNKTEFSSSEVIK
jgi:biopolymer transport protein ExbB/TolQ